MRVRERAAQEAKAQGRLGLVVVDYLQLMAGTSNKESSRANEISEITRGLKSLAGELRCPVIVVSQISRGPCRGDRGEAAQRGDGHGLPGL